MTAPAIDKANKRHAAVLELLLKEEPKTVRQLAQALRSEIQLVRTSLRYLMKRGQVVALNDGGSHNPIFYKAAE